MHDELGTPAELAADCRVVGRNLHLERAAVAAPPRIRCDDYPAEVDKPEIRITEAAARIADALHLHLD